jgi:hypothetical protein
MSGELILVQSARRPSDRHQPLLDELVRIWRSLRDRFLDPYRPELHYMRGPGPKCREKELQRNLALQKAFTTAYVSASAPRPLPPPTVRPD